MCDTFEFNIVRWRYGFHSTKHLVLVDFLPFEKRLENSVSAELLWDHLSSLIVNLRSGDIEVTQLVRIIEVRMDSIQSFGVVFTPLYLPARRVSRRS